MPNNLHSIKSDIDNRFVDISIMIDYLKKEQKIDQRLVLKSSILLMIYNVIEGTFNNILSELFDYITQRNISLDGLPVRLKKTILKYYIKSIGSSVDNLDDFRKMNSQQLCVIDYKLLKKQLNLFSGNLDAKSIREISDQLGVDFPKGFANDDLVKIKTIRNQLAHGEKTYRKASQDITDNELIHIVDSTKKYLNALINIYNAFFERL